MNKTWPNRIGFLIAAPTVDQHTTRIRRGESGMGGFMKFGYGVDNLNEDGKGEFYSMIDWDQNPPEFLRNSIA